MKWFLLAGLGIGTLAAAADTDVDVPVPMVWQFDDKSLVRKQYLRDIDFISENTLVDLLAVAPVGRVKHRMGWLLYC